MVVHPYRDGVGQELTGRGVGESDPEGRRTGSGDHRPRGRTQEGRRKDRGDKSPGPFLPSVSLDSKVP